MGKLSKAKEIVIGILILLVILVGGSLFNETMSSFWYRLINAISNIF